MKIYVSLLALMFSFTTHAQFTQIASGDPFDEPRDGHIKLITNNAGETFYIYINEDGLNIKKYDRQHKPVLDKQLKSIYGSLRRGKLLSVTSSDNAITVFTSEMESRTPALYRQVIDPISCDFRNEQQIDSLPKVKIKVKMAFNVTDRDLNRHFEFFVKTDPATGCYATAAYYSDEEPEKQVRINHYDATHKLLSSACFFVPESKYGYYDYKDMYVDGSKQVVVMAVGSAGKAGKLLAGTLTAGVSSFTIREAAFPGASGITNALIRYNPANNQYVIISIRNKENSINCFRSIWDIAKDTITTEPVTGASLIRPGKAKANSSLLKPAAQKFMMHNDGSYTVIYEDMQTVVKQYTSVGGFGGGLPSTRTSLKFYLNNLALVNYDKDGKLVNSDVLQKSFQVGLFGNITYMADIEESGLPLTWGMQFKSFYYLEGKEKKYIVFNDDEKNQDRLDNHKKPETIMGLENCLAYSIEVEGDGTAKRIPLFKDEVTRKNRPLVIPGAAVYNKSTDELAIIKVNYENKQASVVWLKPE